MTNANNTLIRTMTAEDVILLADLGAQTFREAFATDNTPDDMAAYLEKSFHPEQVAQELADPKSTFLLAEIAGKAVGYAKLQNGDVAEGVSGGKPIELVRLYVLQECIGQGVGAALMQNSINHAKAQGFDTLWLGVWEHNTRAQKFYQKWGFEVVGSHIFVLGNDEQTDWVMQRRLDE